MLGFSAGFERRPAIIGAPDRGEIEQEFPAGYEFLDGNLLLTIL